MIPKTDAATLRVMVVDDDESVRRLLQVALPLSDFPLEIVAEAADGEEAIRVAETSQPDLIILDHMMPVRTGAQAVPELRRVAPKGDIIFFSAYLDSSEIGPELHRASREYHLETVPKGSLEGLESAVARVAGARAA